MKQQTLLTCDNRIVDFGFYGIRGMLQTGSKAKDPKGISLLVSFPAFCAVARANLVWQMLSWVLRLALSPLNCCSESNNNSHEIIPQVFAYLSTPYYVICSKGLLSALDTTYM